MATDEGDAIIRDTKRIVSELRKSENTVSSAKNGKMRKGGSKMSVNANSQNRLETSDDNNSNSALNPVGVPE